MLKLDEKLHASISGLVLQAQHVEHLISRLETLDSDQAIRFSIASTEIALLAFGASEDVARYGEDGERLLRQELSLALWQIGLHCLEIQEWTELIMMQAHYKSIGMNCRSIMSILDLPEPEWDEAIVPRQTDVLTVMEKQDTGLRDSNSSGKIPSDFHNEEYEKTFFLTVLSEQTEEDQTEKLKREIQSLRELLASLVLKRDNLLLVESRELEALYMRELGHLEAEVYREESNARYLQRKYEMMQAAVNRQEKADPKRIEKKLEEQYEAYQKVYEDFIRKAKEAEEAVRNRKDTAKNSADGIRREQEKTEEPGKKQSGETGDRETEEEFRSNGQRKDDTNDRKELPGEDTSSENEKKEPEEPEDEIKRLKKLYRKIVKAMHPDLHPDQDERTKELFKKAIRAYEEGDLRTLEEIAQIIEGETPENSQDLLAALIEEKKRLLELIQGIRAHIRQILNRYPFTKKELLNNPQKLKETQDELRRRLELARQRAEAFRRRIEELEKNG